MRAKLVVVGGDTKTTEVDLRLPAILGRGREATLTLPHPLVSRQHCEITEVEGRLIVRDLGSLNGTFVANERIDEAVLENGQLLTVGTVTFRAVYLDGSTVGHVGGLESDPDPVPDAMQSEETVPVPEATIEAPQPPQPASDTPMAEPVGNADEAANGDDAAGADEDAEDEDDDLSAFFDSLK